MAFSKTAGGTTLGVGLGLAGAWAGCGGGLITGPGVALTCPCDMVGGTLLGTWFGEKMGEIVYDLFSGPEKPGQ